MINELTPEQLRRTFDPKDIDVQTTEQRVPFEGIIGQKRAVSALKFGLGIQENGFNIYVAGPPGIGKMTAVQSFLKEVARKKETPSDWCYVNNFDDSYRPKVFRLPPGQGGELGGDIESLIDHLRHQIPRAFESEDYNSRRDEVMGVLNNDRDIILKQLNEKASQAGFALQVASSGIMIVPVQGEEPLSDEQFKALSETERQELEVNRDKLQEELKVALKQVREVERAVQRRMGELDRQAALYIVGGLIDDLREKYRDSAQVIEYLRAVRSDVLDNIETFKSSLQEPPAQPSEVAPQPASWSPEASFRKYQVNVLVDNGGQEGAPVVVELNPSYNNLFGHVEKEAQFGALSTDFTMIKTGSLHRANGGYLVLPAEDLVRSPYSWDGIKRALRTREIQIEELGERAGFMPTKSLRPQPIPLDVKVVLVGRSYPYYLLYSNDEEFSELFKVRADFDTRMELNEENVSDFVAYLCNFCHKEEVRHLEAGAITKLLEHALRLADDQEKLSTHFGALSDVIREANFWAGEENGAYITAGHINKAIEEKIERSNLIQEHLQEMITRGTILLDTDGLTPGQVNGLSVLSLGDYQFGKPSRITVSVGPGRDGIIDIEREVELGGPIHSKGILILSGYLATRYAREVPLTLAARLVFEQSYEGVEGDSASSTELYALLSALSGLPIKQEIAVTGSVNQNGEVQAIGGVNQKIEGFFDVCKAKGLTGSQGVIIPESNVINLMLREDVVEAVKSKGFHVWAVKTIDEGIEILTGAMAGERGEDGQFPEGSVNFLAQRCLHQFAQSLQKFPDAGTDPRQRSALR